MYEFKDGDRILVTNEDEYKRLLGLLHEQGYEWAGGENLLNETACRWPWTTANGVKLNICIHKSDRGKYIAWEKTDIILFENIAGKKKFTASEVIKICHTKDKMCERLGCDECPIGAHDEEFCDEWQKKHPEETITAIQEYINQEESDNIQAAIKLCEEHGYTAAAEVLRRV